ncbi:MAG: NADH:flavin oxidoreductase [Candidatus Thorarchaeota archaeon]
MKRDDYKVFSEGTIAGLSLDNRLVRSATWEPSILKTRQMSREVLKRYEELALGGVGLIITGGFPAFDEIPGGTIRGYKELRVTGIEGIAKAVHSSAECPIVAQIEDGNLNAKPSDYISPFSGRKFIPLSDDQISDIVHQYVEAIADMMYSGFDGVQLHAAHGSLLSRFLSPYTNQRNDEYGGSISNRVRVVREIVSRARRSVGDYPILIKMNCTDYMEGGIDIDTFPKMASEIEAAGIDAIEVSGGMWDCLLRSEHELGFRPVPAPESHTRINDPENQSYFLKFVQNLDVSVPIILVGGNRNVDLFEKIVAQEKVDFIALARPLIREPNLPNRWLEGRGSPTTECISCNSCIYLMRFHSDRLVTCVHKYDKSLHRVAQNWLSSWVKNIRRKQNLSHESGR